MAWAEDWCSVATRPERRPRDQDRRGGGTMPPFFSFGIGTKAVNRTIAIIRSLFLIFRRPVSPFHGEPLQELHDP